MKSDRQKKKELLITDKKVKFVRKYLMQMIFVYQTATYVNKRSLISNAVTSY